MRAPQPIVAAADDELWAARSTVKLMLLSSDHQISFEKCIAFNPAYRYLWKDYLDALTSGEIAERLSALTEGMDEESQQLCHSQVELSRYCAPHPLLSQIHCQRSAIAALLPPRAQRHLRRLGYFQDHDNQLKRLQEQLGLPELPLPELILHSGLRYLSKRAKRAIRGSIAIDCGAYIGDTARLISCHYGAKQVIAIEPTLDSYARMMALVETWKADAQITGVNAATSDRPGSTVIWGEGVGASLIPKVGQEPVRHEVEVVSIDQLVADRELGRIGLIKLDVEGAENATIEGAMNTIARDRPVLIVSLYHTPTDFFEIKPKLDRLDLGYRFSARKITDDLIKEIVLVCEPGPSQ